MWSFPAKIWQKNAKNDLSTWRPRTFKQALLASCDVIISSQICGSNLQKVFTLGDGCWLPINWARNQTAARGMENSGEGKTCCRSKKQHKHKLFGPDFPRTFLTLTPGRPWVKKFLPITGAAEKRTFWCGRPRFLARTSMTRRVFEKLCTKKVCVDFLAPKHVVGVLRGNTIRGNRTRNSERKMALWEGLWEGLWKPSEKPLKTSEILPLRDPLRGKLPSQNLSGLLPYSCCGSFFLQTYPQNGFFWTSHRLAARGKKKHIKINKFPGLGGWHFFYCVCVCVFCIIPYGAGKTHKKHKFPPPAKKSWDNSVNALFMLFFFGVFFSLPNSPLSKFLSLSCLTLKEKEVSEV